jgi:hypothetical protein
MSNLDWFFRSSRSAPNPRESFSQLYLLQANSDRFYLSPKHTDRQFPLGVTASLLRGLPFLEMLPTTMCAGVS